MVTKSLVLVVDDDADILNIVEEILSLEGYNVETAANGKEALDQVRRSRPGLILLDMRMPVMDGWQFASRLRNQYDKRIPVVVMSAAKDAGQRAREINAEDFLPKPFELDDLVHKVQQHLHS